MLSAHGLSCLRGERRLFAGLDLCVAAGGWLHLRGENGAGKTSLLRLLAGLSAPAAGEVRWQGQPIRQVVADYHREMLFLGHQAAVKEELSPLENLCMAAELDGQTLPEADALAALRRFGLKGRERLNVRYLSAGQRRRVLLARLLTRPARLWLLDEPFTALDVKGVDMLSTLIRTHLEAGGMAVMTSHQAIALDGGQVVQL